MWLKDRESAPILTSNRSWENVVPLFSLRKQANMIFQSIKWEILENIENCLHSVIFYISQRDFQILYVLTELIQLHLLLQFQFQDTFTLLGALRMSNCFIFHCQTLQPMGGAQRLKSLWKYPLNKTELDSQFWSTQVKFILLRRQMQDHPKILISWYKPNPDLHLKTSQKIIQKHYI